MATFDRPDDKLLAKAVFAQRWSALARAGTDVGTIDTWDRRLPRDQRILVPIDVQAFVVPLQGGELTVPMKGHDAAGLSGADPEPFAPGSVKPLGVHLHWAMPDSLLVGKRNNERTQPTLPALPDRWVVVRALLPVGRSRALVSGWVIDAPTGTITPLATFSGTFPPAPGDMELFEPLDAGYGGSLLWTASYEAASRRFALHDPLDDLGALADLAPNGFVANHAVYTVSGWWSDGRQDPLSGVEGSRRLDRRLADLSWLVVHDGDDDLLMSPDPRLERLRDHIGFDTVDSEPAVEVLAKGSKQRLVHEGIVANVAMPVSKAAKVILGPQLPRYSTLVHGAVLGVPIDGALHPADDRPSPASVSIAVGLDVDDVVSAFGTEALGLTAGQRAAGERLVAAFAGNLLDHLSSADGLSDLDAREHGDGFWSFPGPPLPGAQPDRLREQDSAAVNPFTVGRKGRAASASREFELVATKVAWKQTVHGLKRGVGSKTSKVRDEEPVRDRASVSSTLPESRQVVRPAPRMFRPQPPLVALRGAKPSHRHHDDGLYDESGKLRCRYPRECVTAVDGVVDGATILPTLGNGAIPGEVLSIVREALLLDPYAHGWLAAAGAPPSLIEAATIRLAGEMVRLYGTTASYDPSGRAAVVPNAFGMSHDGLVDGPMATSDSWAQVSSTTKLIGAQIAAELANFSLMNGTPPSPIAITTWRQPWVPLWLEWRVTLTGDETIDGWELGPVDLQPATDGGVRPSTSSTFEFVGRSLVNEGVGKALRSGIEAWLAAEQTRDAAHPPASQLSEADEQALDSLADTLAPVDLVSASLDGIREQLLGMPYVSHVARGPVGSDGTSLPLAAGLPVPLFGGILRIDQLRLVDAFGRTLDVPVNVAHTTTTLEVAGAVTSMQLRPRIQHGARWLFRLVDPSYPTTADPVLAPEAFVDQTNAELAVNPVVGFLLPDHMDEALEFFDVAGTPLGQLAHDEISGAVTWQPAPGRPLPPDAGPLADLDTHTRLVGALANGVVQADVTARGEPVPPEASALSAMLRAIDTTLWAIDTYGAIGSPSVAGLIGRPIAVVRATLRLETPDDIGEVAISEASGADGRRAAFEVLGEQLFPLRLGDLHRSDDSLLGFFVDDDYLGLHVVDRVVMGAALESGRHRGFQGLLGSSPGPDRLDHRYIVEEDTLWVRPGQTLRLTLLMLPAGKAHLTSGILPRKSLALGNDWVTPGLVKLMPSLRVGPVLVDPSEIRLPLVNVLGDQQTFTRRTGPLTWRDDPIVAATQTALLPRMPHEVQEGWIRVTPTEPGPG